MTCPGNKDNSQSQIPINSKMDIFMYHDSQILRDTYASKLHQSLQIQLHPTVGQNDYPCREFNISR